MIRILLADDHKMIIDGLQSMLASVEEIEVVGEAFTGTEVLKKVKQNQVDIILMDINMPELDGILTTQKVKKEYPETKVLILTMYNKPEFIRNLLEAGASGYILKNTGREELLEAIKQISNGQNYFGREVTKTVMESLRGTPRNTTFNLTKREKEVLRLIVQECTTSEIADQLFISTHTVETHRKNLLSKLNVKNTAGLVKYALDNGYLI